MCIALHRTVYLHFAVHRLARSTWQKSWLWHSRWCPRSTATSYWFTLAWSQTRDQTQQLSRGKNDSRGIYLFVCVCFDFSMFKLQLILTVSVCVLTCSTCWHFCSLSVSHPLAPLCLCLSVCLSLSFVVSVCCCCLLTVLHKVVYVCL